MDVRHQMRQRMNTEQITVTYFKRLFCNSPGKKITKKWSQSAIVLAQPEMKCLPKYTPDIKHTLLM